MKSIPIDQIVEINPSVVGTGSNPLALNGVMIGQGENIPVGNLLTFFNADDAGVWFGTTSPEYKLSQVYFNGFTNAKKYPNQLMFYAMPKEARGAWARGASLKGMTLAQLKTIAGTLKVSVNGEDYESSQLDLSNATSFTDAATRIQGFLSIVDVATVTWDSLTSRFVIKVTDDLETSEISQITGTAAAKLGLDAAVLSQGSAAVSITDTLAAIKGASLNWATFSFIEQLTIAEMTEAALWSNGQKSRYLFVNSDNDPNAKVFGNEECFGHIAGLAEYDGVMNVYDANDVPLTKAFIQGVAASVDWKQTEGRVNLAFRNQAGLPTTCDEESVAEALLFNGYSYYGQYAASGPNNTYAFIYNGELCGKFKWFDTFINQVYLNSQLQKGVMDLLLAVNSLPYNNQGYSMLRNACQDPINEALNNGTIRAGISLSESQKTQIIQQVGYDITSELFSYGYYLQIKDADAQTRGNRQSPPINFFYCDGGSIQQVTIPSIVVL